MKDTFTTSHSKVKTFQTCKRQYHYKYALKLTRKIKSRPLKFGGLVHDRLSAHIRGEAPQLVEEWKKRAENPVTREEGEMTREALASSNVIVKTYHDYWKKRMPLKHRVWKGLQSEHYFAVEIAPGVIWRGFIDDLVQTEDGLHWVFETKTFSQHMNPDFYWMDVQTNIYSTIAQIYGMPNARGTLWNFISSKEPTVPQQLKDGSLSSKYIRTLPRVVVKEGRRLGLKPSQYSKAKLMAKAQLPEWFIRRRSPIRPAVNQHLLASFIEESIAAKDYKHPDPPRSINRHCTWCDYRLICQHELTDGDAEYIKDTHYEKSQDRPPVTEYTPYKEVKRSLASSR